MVSLGLFVTGTDTNVGKTWVTAALAASIQHYLDKRSGANQAERLRIQLWKPVQSGVREGDLTADSCRLRHGSGLEHAMDIASISLEEPLAPWIAAERAGRSVDWSFLLEEGLGRLSMPNTAWMIEGAGGLLVPLTPRHTIADLAEAMGLPVLIVARPTLGTVNHTLMTVECIRRRGLKVAGVLLNGERGDDARAAAENVRMIEQFGDVKVWGLLPWMEAAEPQNEQEWQQWRREAAAIMERSFDIEEAAVFFRNFENEEK